MDLCAASSPSGRPAARRSSDSSRWCAGRLDTGGAIRRCPHLWLAKVLAFVFFVLVAARHAPAQTGPLVENLRGEGSVLVDPTGKLTVEQVNARFEAGEGAAARPEQVMPTGGGTAIWYRIDLPKMPMPPRMTLVVPHPGLDRAEFYRPAPGTGWSMEASGDEIPVAQWPLRNLYPSFRFGVQPGEDRYSYLRIQHSQPINLYWTLSDSGSFVESSKLWHMALAFYAGLVLLVAVQAALNGLAWRDPIDLRFSVHVAVAALAQLSLMGLAGEYLWPHLPWWNDRAPITLSLLALATLHLLVRRLVVERGARWLSRGLLAMALVGGLLALGFLAIGRDVFFRFAPPYGLASFAVLVGVAAWYAWHHRKVGVWVLAATLALAIGGSLPVLRTLHVLPLNPATQHGAPAGVGLEIALMLIALHFRSRQRRDSQGRVGALGRVDPLTGVANHRMLVKRLDQLLQRQRRDPNVGAVVRVRISNAVDIRQEYGMEAAQGAIVHAAACITELARGGDTVARHRDGDFVLILGGHTTRDQLSDLGQRLIARGLGASLHLPVTTALQLKVAIAPAPFNADDTTALLQRLGMVLSGLAARSGKALRFA
jgi:two-component system, sensor histidine kinase LadS